MLFFDVHYTLFAHLFYFLKFSCLDNEGYREHLRSFYEIIVFILHLYDFTVGFFNHLFKKKWNEEPTPLEVEMYLYQENLDQYVVAEEYRKMNKAAEGRGNES